MKAVNLIPHDSRRRGIAGVQAGAGSSYALIGLLVLAVLFVTIDVLTANTISHRKAKLAAVNAQTVSAQALATRLQPYATFAQLAQARTSTVRTIAAARFNWQGALVDLARVVPANTSLSAVNGSVAPGAGSGGSTSGELRGDISVPAFELAGCTRTQDDVATLMSRLRLISGVTRVSFEDAQKSGSATSGASPSSTSGTAGCPANSPTFDIVVFFQPMPSAGPDGVVSAGSTTPGATS
jgi:Tfp pilus assembly protein PilN